MLFIVMLVLMLAMLFGVIALLVYVVWYFSTHVRSLTKVPVVLATSLLLLMNGLLFFAAAYMMVGELAWHMFGTGLFVVMPFGMLAPILAFVTFASARRDKVVLVGVILTSALVVLLATRLMGISGFTTDVPSMVVGLVLVATPAANIILAASRLLPARASSAAL